MADLSHSNKLNIDSKNPQVQNFYSVVMESPEMLACAPPMGADTQDVAIIRCACGKTTRDCPGASAILHQIDNDLSIGVFPDTQYLIDLLQPVSEILIYVATTFPADGLMPVVIGWLSFTRNLQRLGHFIGSFENKTVEKMFWGYLKRLSRANDCPNTRNSDPEECYRLLNSGEKQPCLSIGQFLQPAPGCDGSIWYLPCFYAVHTASWFIETTSLINPCITDKKFDEAFMIEKALLSQHDIMEDNVWWAFSLRWRQHHPASSSRIQSWYRATHHKVLKTYEDYDPEYYEDPHLAHYQEFKLSSFMLDAIMEFDDDGFCPYPHRNLPPPPDYSPYWAWCTGTDKDQASLPANKVELNSRENVDEKALSTGTKSLSLQTVPSGQGNRLMDLPPELRLIIFKYVARNFQKETRFENYWKDSSCIIRDCQDDGNSYVSPTSPGMVMYVDSTKNFIDIGRWFTEDNHCRSHSPDDRLRNQLPCDVWNKGHLKQPAITRVSRRLRQESLPLFYSENTFSTELGLACCNGTKHGLDEKCNPSGNNAYKRFCSWSKAVHVDSLAHLRPLSIRLALRTPKKPEEHWLCHLVLRICSGKRKLTCVSVAHQMTVFSTARMNRILRRTARFGQTQGGIFNGKNLIQTVHMINNHKLHFECQIPDPDDDTYRWDPTKEFPVAEVQLI